MENELGKGAVNIALLPSPKTQDPSSSQQAYASSEGREKIMLVDDEPEILNSQGMLLTMLGYEVVGLDDPLEALERFRNAPQEFDLIITDLTMPKMTGTELAARLAETRPDLPVILTTGYSDTVLSAVDGLPEIRELVTKPVRIRDLSGVIRRLMDRQNEPSATPGDSYGP